MTRVLNSDFGSSGDYACIHCGEVMHFYFNGGELDENHCCGLTYRTECVRVQLVVDGEEEKP